MRSFLCKPQPAITKLLEFFNVSVEKGALDFLPVFRGNQRPKTRKIISKPSFIISKPYDLFQTISDSEQDTIRQLLIDQRLSRRCPYFLN